MKHDPNVPNDNERRLLVFLHERGPRRLEQVVRHMAWTADRTRRLLDRVEAKGWIRKTVQNVPDPFFGVRVVLTYRHVGHVHKLLNRRTRAWHDSILRIPVLTFEEAASKYLKAEQVAKAMAILKSRNKA